MVSGERDGRSSGAVERRRRALPGSLTRWRFVLITIVASIAVSPLRAAEFVGEDPLPLRDVVGAGIHAYHAGDFQRAYDDLTNAIEAGTEDPRGYYFRGLAALRLGRTSEAEADFTVGADRELATGGLRRVSQSLERVQGPDRLTLERFRSRARVGALQREREAFGRRYSTIEDATSDVRRRRRPEDIRPELVAPGNAANGSQAPLGVEEVPPPPAAKPTPPKPANKPAPKPTKTFEDEAAEEGDDPFADKPSAPSDDSEDEQAERDVQDEEMDAEVEDTAAERDVQDEAMDAEDEDTEAERDVQAEVDAASGQ